MPGEFRAPMGRLREGQYFCFCLDHVREYNATYNYFDGMTDDAVARWMKDDTIGHRPTWAMGVNRAGKPFREDATAHPAIRSACSATGRAAGRPSPCVPATA